jgi:hypothetical protein
MCFLAITARTMVEDAHCVKHLGVKLGCSAAARAAIVEDGGATPDARPPGRRAADPHALPAFSHFGRASGTSTRWG